MDIIRSILQFFDTKMPTPGLFGLYHILSLAVTAGVTVWLCLRYRNAPPGAVRKLLRAVSILVIALEVYKQINFSFGYTDSLTFDYQWYAFPFQFCSTPMYIGLLAGLTGKGRIHRAACDYLATYAVFAGLCVMVYPGDVFTATVGINIQTMVCHGSMVTVGAVLYACGYVTPSKKTLLRAMVMFAVCVGIAMVMNEIAYFAGLLDSHTFNMFYISPHCPPHLPVYSLIQNVVPFPFCLLLYILGFTAAAGIITLCAKGLLSLRKQKATA